MKKNQAITSKSAAMNMVKSKNKKLEAEIGSLKKKLEKAKSKSSSGNLKTMAHEIKRLKAENSELKEMIADIYIDQTRNRDSVQDSKF